MEGSTEENGNFIKSWETYKILEKIKENVHQKRRIARDVEAHQSLDAYGNQITIDKRLNTTKEQLNDLLCDGTELITNIKLANERREASRRLQEDRQRHCLLTDLQQESEEATSKIGVINKRWTELAEISDPMELNERLCHQNERIENLMQQKDAIIFELQNALNKASNTYNTDQMKQQGDIQSLIDRVDEQIDVMKSVYLEHLELLHQSIDSERRAFKLFHSNEWQNLYDDRTTDSEQNLNDLLERKERYYGEIVSTRLEHEEINRKTRIKLDRDNDLVQQKVQRTKAEIELNTEQLKYNYYVLQKRASENIVVRNKQKNRLIQMRSCIAMLRKRINETKMAHTIDIERQTHNALNLYATIKEFEYKINVFNESDDKKFQHIWKLHEANLDSKLENLMIIDKIIYEKHLGLQWEPFSLEKSLRPNQLQVILSAIDATRTQCVDDFNSIKSLKNQVDDICGQENIVSDFFDTISEQISSRMNWMLGEKFTEILNLIDDDEQKRIITIDNIFTALGMNNSKNIYMLKNYFLPYASCIYCSKKYSETNGNSYETDPSGECVEDHHKFTNLFVEEHMIPIIMQQILIDLDTKALPSRQIPKNNSNEAPIPLHLIDLNEVKQFWNDYVSSIPNDLELIWDTLVNGQLRYLQILKNRKKLISECNFLRQQNIEITHLLQQYAKDD